jgi:hypothetical protein
MVYIALCTNISAVPHLKEKIIDGESGNLHSTDSVPQA